LSVSTGGVYANGSFARGAEKQKNKLADDGGLITTIVFHQRFFHSLFFTHCFSPTHLSTAVYPPLSLTVVSIAPCVVVVRSRRHHTHYHLHFHLHSQLTFTFTLTLTFTLGSNLKLFASVRLLFGSCLASVWFCLVIVWFRFGYCLVLAWF